MSATTELVEEPMEDVEEKILDGEMEEERAAVCSYFGDKMAI